MNDDFKVIVYEIPFSTGMSLTGVIVPGYSTTEYRFLHIDVYETDLNGTVNRVTENDNVFLVHPCGIDFSWRVNYNVNDPQHSGYLRFCLILSKRYVFN